MDVVAPRWEEQKADQSPVMVAQKKLPQFFSQLLTNIFFYRRAQPPITNRGFV